MDKKELKDLLYVLDKRQGNFPMTLAQKERRMQKIENIPDKVLMVVSWLHENNIKFYLYELLHKPIETKINKHYMFADIYLPEHQIVMRYVDEKDEVSVAKCKWFFGTFKNRSYPMFIRSGESDDFIIDKIKRTIKKSAVRRDCSFNRKIVPVIKKRPRMKAVKCVPVKNKFNS